MENLANVFATNIEPPANFFSFLYKVDIIVPLFDFPLAATYLYVSKIGSPIIKIFLLFLFSKFLIKSFLNLILSIFFRNFFASGVINSKFSFIILPEE